MVTRYLDFYADENYHVYNRGNSKQNIFISHSDYQRFFYLLRLLNTEETINVRNILRNEEDPLNIKLTKPLVKIHAVCLMPNHYHLLITPIKDKNLSQFMLKLGTSYSMYFNKKYERTGSLFEGRFKAKHANTDEYLKYLFSYIHLNPVKKDETLKASELFAEAVKYPYSSLAVYTEEKPSLLPRAALGREEIIDKELMGRYLPTQGNIKRELMDWLEFDEL